MRQLHCIHLFHEHKFSYQNMNAMRLGITVALAFLCLKCALPADNTL